MMYEYISLISSLWLPLWVGMKLLRIIIQQKVSFYLIEKLLIAWGLGWGVVTLWMLLLSILNIKYSVLSLGSVLLIVLILEYVLKQKSFLNKNLDVYKEEVAGKDFSKFEKFFLLFLKIISGIFIIYLFMATMGLEIDMWDSWDLWAFKAKIFFYHGRIPFELFADFKKAYGHWDYPQHVPLMQTWIMTWLGEFNDFWPRLIFPIFHVGLAGLIFSYLKRYYGLLAAWTGFSFILSIRFLQVCTIGTMTETTLIYYYIAAILFLIRGVNEGNKHLIILSAIFSGLSAWTKNEGLFLILCNIVVLLITVSKDGRRDAIVYLMICLSITLPWIALKKILSLSNDFIVIENFGLQHINENLYRVAKLPQDFFSLVFYKDFYNISWIMFGAALVRKCFINKQKNFNQHAVLVSLVLQVILFVCFYLTYPDLKTFANYSLPRLLLLPTVLVVVYALMIFVVETKEG